MKGHCLKPGLRHDPRGRSSRRGLRAGRGTRSWWPQPTEPQLRDQYPLRIPQRGQSDQRRSAGSNGTPSTTYRSVNAYVTDRDSWFCGPGWRRAECASTSCFTACPAVYGSGRHLASPQALLRS